MPANPTCAASGSATERSMSPSSTSADERPLSCPRCAISYPLSERFCENCGMPLVYKGRGTEVESEDAERDDLEGEASLASSSELSPARLAGWVMLAAFAAALLVWVLYQST